MSAGRINRPTNILIHGAANSSLVWTFWQKEFTQAGFSTNAIDLRGHEPNSAYDLSQTGMGDYVKDIHEACKQLEQIPILIGWSMGGLLAMMAAAKFGATACIALAPSTPAREANSNVELRTGFFDSSEYDILSPDPDNQPAMPDLSLDERKIALASLRKESLLARTERKRGIFLDSLPCPLLIVTGSHDEYWPKKCYDNLWLQADYIDIEACSHWGLVLNNQAVSRMASQVIDWIEGKLKP